MKTLLRWTAASALLLICLWVFAIAQAPSITVPFATAPILAETSTSVNIFFRTLNGSYLSAGYGFSSRFPVLSGMSVLAELVSQGVSNLIAAPAGPPNVGRASQMFAGGKFTSGGAPGAAYLFFNDSYLHIATGTASLLVNPTTTYNIGPFPAGVVMGDFNGDGVLDVAAVFLGENSPGGLAVFINNGDGTLKSPLMYAAGNSPISLATLDLNKDGVLDLAVADNASSSVYVLLGNGDGTFKASVAYPAGSNGLSITLADFNGDGNPDIAETAEDGNVTILFNNGSGSFHAGPIVQTPGKSPFYIAAGDLNGDGRNDLVIADGGNSTITIYLNSGSGNFAQGLSYPTSFSPNSLILTDYNGDGKLDILNASGDARVFGPSSDSGNIDLFLGNGDGTFQAPVFTPGGGTTQNPFLAVADFNGDGIPDAVVPGNAQTVFLFPGTKTGAFKTPTTVSTGQISPNGGASGDFNGDGKPDLAVTDANSATVGILLNTGAGFQTPSTFSSGGQGPAGIVAADFNGDGKLDLAVANSGSGTTAVFLGGGNGAFQLASTYPTGKTPSQVIAADLNGDGKPDLVVLDPGSLTVSNGAIYVLLNNGAGGFNAPVSYSPSNYPISVSAGDINGDGKPDLVVAVQDAQVNYHLAILLNTGSGSFAPATLINTEFGPSSIAIRDFNADGKADLVVAHCCGATNMTYLQGNRNGTFSSEVDFNGGTSPDLAQVTDFNGDGAPDLAIFLTGGGSASGMVGLLNTARAAMAGSFTNLEAAGASANIAQQAIVSAYAASTSPAHLGATTVTASSAAWPTTLGGTTVSILDSAGVASPAPIYYVSPGQVNYALPPGTALGAATVTITASDGTTSSGPASIVAVSPGLFVVGTNLAAANVIRVSGGAQTPENDYMVDSSGNVVPRPIPLSPGQVYLVLYGTGIRNAPLSAVSVTVGGSSVPVQFAGAQQTYMGLDQVNMGPLPASLAGAGDVVIQLTASGIAANPVHITVQ